MEPSKQKSVTVVYDIVDEAWWIREGGNPLSYQHHGLKACSVAAYDAVERCRGMREELERLRELVGREDVESIDAVLADPE